ncbi:hypothetical protein EV652_108360 [Kribbella steppae]|uniref:Uncharacterized protein n=1 Tax=Kribbella steppae TaxID=2512223 RepID=A0A4R2HC20_9ACTN|nr:hypothetical protein EV652_108360 [Kribbella steppae]
MSSALPFHIVIVAPGPREQAQARFRVPESFRPVHASYPWTGTPPVQEPEVVMTVFVALAIAAGVLLLGTCSFVVLRRRGRARG